MTKALLTSAIFPPDVGGPATYVERVARTMHGLNWDVEVVTSSDARSSSATPYAFAVHRISRAKALPIRMLTQTLVTARLAGRASFVYANGAYPESALAALIARRPLFMKIVGDFAWERSFNSGETSLDIKQFQESGPRSLRQSSVRRAQRWWCRRANGIIVGSRFLAGIVAGWGVAADKIEVVPNSVEIPDGTPRFLAPSPGPLVRVVSGGRFVMWKNLDILIEMTALHQDVHLTLIGSGETEPALRDLAEMRGVTDRVTFRRPIPPRSMVETLRTFDVFALPSSSETFSYLTIEAMAAGLPVIVADSGALPEVVGYGEFGSIVPSMDSSAWAEAVQELRDPVRFLKRAERGYEAVKTLYSWGRVWEQTVRVLRGKA